MSSIHEDLTGQRDFSSCNSHSCGIMDAYIEEKEKRRKLTEIMNKETNFPAAILLGLVQEWKEKIELSNRLKDMEKDIQTMKAMQVMPATIKILDIHYKFNVVFEIEKDAFVASIPDIKLASQGCTRIDALNNLTDLVIFYFEDEDSIYIKQKLGPYIM